MPFNQRQIIEQAKFAHSPLGKALEKQIEKQVGTLKSLDSSNEKKCIKKNWGYISTKSDEWFDFC